MSDILADLARRDLLDQQRLVEAAVMFPRLLASAQQRLVEHVKAAAESGLKDRFGVEVDVEVEVSSISDRRPSEGRIGDVAVGGVRDFDADPLIVRPDRWLFASGWFHANGKLCRVYVAVLPAVPPVVDLEVVVRRWWGVRRRRVSSAFEFHRALVA